MKNSKMRIDAFRRKAWYLNGKLHRTDGPAMEYANGSKIWYLKGQLHRLDGPAVERTDGSNAWWLNDQFYGNGDIPPADYTLATLILHGMSQ